VPVTIPPRSLRLLVAAWLAIVGTGAVGCGAGSASTGPDEDRPTSTEQPGGDDTEARAGEAGGAGVPPLHPEIDGYPEALVTIRPADGATITIPVKVADEPERRQRGLMHVPELPDGTGMLFVYEEERVGGFWMKDTLVPLDIAYIDAGGEVVDILAMDPCEADPCPSYTPATPYRAALEVPQGWFAAEEVRVGDEVTYRTTQEP
jgi:uncharacterized protein